MATTTDVPPSFLDEENYIRENNAPPNCRVAAANAVVHICRTTKSGHILVYAPGSGEIATIKAMINKTCRELHVSVLFSALSLEMQREALRLASDRDKRRCLIATDIAIKAPAQYSIRYIVDTGLRKLSIYNPRLNMCMLETRPISRATAEHRSQKAAGCVCVRLYPYSAYEEMPEEDDRDHLNESAHLEVLRLLAGGVTNLAYYHWEKTPYPDTLARAVQDLVAMDLVDEDGKLTDTGKLVNAIAESCTGLEPAWALAIHEAARLGCIEEVVAIAAICSAKSDIFQDHIGIERIAGIVQAKFANGPSDHLALLNAYAQYQCLVRQSQPLEVTELWCKLHTLNLNALKEVDEMVKKILTRAVVMKPLAQLSQNASAQRKGLAGRDAAILEAIARGFCTQIALHKGPSDRYCTFDTNVEALLHAKSALVGIRSQWVVYTRLSRRSRRHFLDIVSAVDVNWLLGLKNFQPGALGLGRDGKVRQPAYNAALDAARANATAIATPEENETARKIN
ncbi:hypothetical protein PWT90_05066 [Aphanocladium album]|nr:hypothetical protein PWT90_05066 [Aphanocladium album]